MSSKLTENDKQVILSALNFALKNEPDALKASGVIIPIAAKVQAMEVEAPPAPAPAVVAP